MALPSGVQARPIASFQLESPANLREQVPPPAHQRLQTRYYGSYSPSSPPPPARSRTAGSTERCQTLAAAARRTTAALPVTARVGRQPEASSGQCWQPERVDSWAKSQRARLRVPCHWPLIPLADLRQLIIEQQLTAMAAKIRDWPHWPLTLRWCQRQNSGSVSVGRLRVGHTTRSQHRCRTSMRERFGVNTAVVIPCPSASESTPLSYFHARALRSQHCCRDSMPKRFGVNTAVVIPCPSASESTPLS